MAVDDERRAAPEIHPERRAGALGALAGPTLRIDHLDAGDDLSGLALPRLAGQEPAVDEDGVEVCVEMRERHRGEEIPVGGP